LKEGDLFTQSEYKESKGKLLIAGAGAMHGFDKEKREFEKVF